MTNKKETKSLHLGTRVTPSVFNEVQEQLTKGGESEAEFVRDAIELKLALLRGKGDSHLNEAIRCSELEIQQLTIQHEINLKNKQRKHDTLLHLKEKARERSVQQQQDQLLKQYEEHNKHLALPDLFRQYNDEEWQQHHVITPPYNTLKSMGSSEEHCFEIFNEVNQLVKDGVVDLITPNGGRTFKIIPNGGTLP